MSIKSDSGKWGLVVLVWIVLAIPVIAGIWYLKFRSKESLEEGTSSQSQYQHEIRMAGDWFSGYCLLRSDELQKELKKKGIRLQYEDDGADYEARLKALDKGKIDMAPFPINSLVEMCETLKMSPATIILFIDETKGADAIVAYKDAVKSLDDLNQEDTRFVLTPGSPSEYLARVVKADMDMSNLSHKWISEADGAGEVYQRLKKGGGSKPTAYVLWEPYVSQALRNEDLHVVFGSDKIKGHIVDALVVRRKFLSEEPDVVREFVEAYLRINYSFSDSDKMVELVRRDAKAAGEKLSKADAESIVKGIQWKNTLENFAHFRLLSRRESLGLDDVEDIIEKITNVLKVTESIEEPTIEAHTLFYNTILEELQASGFHPKQKLGIIEGASETLSEIRTVAELPALSESQWEQLIPVGKMRIPNLSFRRGTAELNPQSRRYLEELSTKLKSMPMYYLKVIGHARAEGDPEANLALAKERASTATQYLIQRRGVKRNRILTTNALPSDTDGSAQSVTFELMQRAY